MKSRNFKSIKHQAGLGIIELLIVIGIILGVLAFIFLLSGYASAIVNAYRGANSTLAHMTNIQTVYNGTPSYAGTSTAGIAKESIIDKKYLAGGAGTISNVFGGQVTVAPGTTNGLANNTLLYTDGSVAKKACSFFVSSIADSVDTIDVAGTVIKAFGGSVDAPALATACASAESVAVTSGKIKPN
ncbi:MAG: type 4 pilus major pilin [Candidatus Saccharibacteria bacterium]|nr:type 4 pilus major pilin [Candidatus Saccharibacteria bacterium]